MPRLRRIALAVPCCVGMMTAAPAMQAHAQTMAPPAAAADPLTPLPDSDPRDPKRFQKFDRTSPPRVGQPPSRFSPPASSAGRTGFKSVTTKKTPAPANSNARTTTSPAPIAGSLPAATPPSTIIAPITATTTRTSQAPQRSPTSLPPIPQVPADARAALAAGPPGRPAVDLGTPAVPTTAARRRRPVAEVDPYAPIGVRAGSFNLFPAVELVGGYDSNPGKFSRGEGSPLISALPELRAQSDWSRHELKADLRGSYTYFTNDQTPTLSRPFADGRVDGRIDVTRDTRIDLGGRVNLGTDNPNSPNLPTGIDKLPVFTTFGGYAGIAHRFNRLEVGARATAERTAWGASELVDGTSFSNEDRNFNQYGGALRASYEVLPGMMPFAEASADSRVHDLETDFSGYRRNSDGVTAKLGSTFEFSRLLTGEFSVGYTTRSYDDPRLERLQGVLFDASLLWTASALTNVRLSGRSSVGESTIPGVSGILYRDAGLQIDHAFRRWLIGTVKFGFGVDEYIGNGSSAAVVSDVCSCVLSSESGGVAVDRRDLRYSIGAGITYKLNRSAQLKGEYRHEWLTSNVANAAYSADIFLAGLRLQY